MTMTVTAGKHRSKPLFGGGAALCVLSLVTMAHAQAAAPIHLTGQNAVYTLSLAKVRGHSVTGAVGRLTFDVTATCKAFAVDQRLTLLVRNGDGSLSRTVSDYETWESRNGHHFSFLLRQSENGKGRTELKGTATMTAKGGTVHYVVPAQRTAHLPPGTLFPMAHTRALLTAAEAGKPYIDPPLFDGTSSHGAEHTFVAILGWHKGKPDDFKALSGLPSTTVDIGFFPRLAKDNTPDFRTEAQYFTNGVARDVRLDFGNFVLRGKLAQLTMPPQACPEAQSASNAASTAKPKSRHVAQDSDRKG